MSRQYQPQTPFNVPFKILTLTKSFVNGVNKQTYVEGEEIYFCSAKAWVGSVKTIDNVSGEEDTLTVDTWFIPTLKKNDRIKLLDDDSIWELPISPENINRRGQFMRFKVVKYNG